jgi:2'-5' RNA ligase
MRLFVAVFPSPEAIEHLAATVAQLNLTRRVIPPDRWHITLAFLGDVPLDREGPTQEALRRVAVAVGAVSVASGGRFGQVVWAGVGGDAERLTRLSRAVRRELRAVRVRPDDKRFRPHLTIARSAAGLSTEDMTKLTAYQGPSWPVKEVVLVRSELGPHPEYHRLGAWPVSSAPG